MKTKQLLLIFSMVVIGSVFTLSSSQEYLIEGRKPTEGEIIPLVFMEGKYYVLLSQDAADKHAITVNEQGDTMYPYSVFGGKFEPEDTTIEETILRELKEESLIQEVCAEQLHSDEKLRSYVFSRNTSKVMVYGFPSLPNKCKVILQTDFTPLYQAFKDGFYKARHNELSGAKREDYLAKKGLALCDYGSFRLALIASQPREHVFVEARVIDENKEEIYQKILIRQSFASSSKLFCLLNAKDKEIPIESPLLKQTGLKTLEYRSVWPD
jgi:hypothetical protein